MATNTFSLEEAYGAVPDKKVEFAKPSEKTVLTSNHHATFNELASSFGATITSLDRTPEHNREVGGKANSQHLRGSAGDFVVPADKKADFMQTALTRGYKAIDEGDHIHLQALNSSGGGGGGSKPVLPIEESTPQSKTFSLDEAYGADANTEQTHPLAQQPKPAAKSTGNGFLDLTNRIADWTNENIGRPTLEAAEDIGGVISRRYKEEFEGQEKRGNIPFKDQELEWRQRLAADPSAVKDLPKYMSHLKPEAEVHGFINSLENPVKLMTGDSLPANFLSYYANLDVGMRKKFDAAREVMMQENIVANPSKFPAVSVAAAQAEIDKRKAKQDPGVRQMWDELKQAAKEDPGKFGGQLVNALVADPELLLAPAGLGTRVLGRTAELAKGAQVTSKVVKLADQVLDAGSVAAAMNMAITAQDKMAQGVDLSLGELKMAAGMGAVIGGPLGLIFSNGARAKTLDLDNARMKGTLEDIISDRAKYDVEMENAISHPDSVDPNARARIDAALGITSKTDRAKMIADRRRQAKETFKNETDFADYEQAKAAYRMERLAAQQEATAAKAKTEAAQRQVAAQASEVRITSPETPQGVEGAAVLQALAKPGHLRTAEDMVAIRALRSQSGKVDDRLLKAMGVSAAAATAGAAMFPEAPEKGALAGVLLSGLAFGRGSRSRMGGPSAASQRGAIRNPFEGEWSKGTAKEITSRLEDGPITEAWATKAVKTYLSKHAGTSTDPLKDIELPTGHRWEDLTDRALRFTEDNRDWGTTYSDFKRELGIPKNVDKPIFDLYNGSDLMSYLDHVGDYILTEVPKDKLPQYDLVRAVKETVAWDKANLAKAAKARVKSMEGMPVYKEYPDGSKWVQLTKPGEFAQESDVMGHSVRGYEPHGKGQGDYDYDGLHDPYAVIKPHEDWIPESGNQGNKHYGVGTGGWDAIKDGSAKVYSLRGPDGQSHVTIEVETSVPVSKGHVTKLVKPNITQIKGKGNAAPAAKYLPMVQDFVKSGEWAEVGDLQNAQMIKTGGGLRTKEVIDEFLYQDPLMQFKGLVLDKAERDLAQARQSRSVSAFSDEPLNPNNVEWLDRHRITTLQKHVDNAEKEIARYKNEVLQRSDIPEAISDIKVTRDQSGKASPELLARLAVVAAASAAGFALAPDEHRLAGTMFGGLAGLVIPGGGTVLRRMRQSGAISGDGTTISFTEDAARLIAEGKLKPDAAIEKVKADDLAKVERAKAGDQGAMKELYEATVPKLERMVGKMLREAGPKLGLDASDVVQDAMVKAFQNLDQFKGDANFFTWTYSIARNEALDAITKARRQPESVSYDKPNVGGDETAPLTGDVYLKPKLESNKEGFSPEDVESGEITPEDAAFQVEADRQIAYALKALSLEKREVLTKIIVEGKTEAEVAAELGIPIGTVKSRAFQARAAMAESIAKGYGAKPVKPMTPPRSQRGAVDEQLLKTGALVALGAGVGGAAAYMNDKNVAYGAGLGALASIGLRTKGKTGKTTGAQIVEGADYLTGLISTRIMNKSKELWMRALNHERVVLRDTHKHLKAVDPFLVQLEDLKPEIQGLISRAILTGDPVVVDRFLQELSNKKLIDGWKDVRSTLDSLGDQLVHLKRFKKKELGYFPRIVKDVPGLLKALGREQGGYIEELLRDADIKAIRARGTGLSDLERSLIINGAMKGDKLSASQPGFAKKRVIGEITPELQQYYAKPTESLHSYIRAAVQDIERAKFFGQDLEVVTKDGVEYTNPDASIGKMVDRLIGEGKLKAEDQAELSSMLKSRFILGERTPSEFVQGAKNLSTAGLLGNPVSAATQLGDMFVVAYAQDIRSTLQAVVRQLTGRKIVSMKDFGLSDHIAEEFVSTSRTTKFLNGAFKYGLFKHVDEMGKNTALNAAVIRAGRLAKSEKGIEVLGRRYAEALGPAEFKQWISDLQKGEKSDLVNQMAFAELSRTQPITRLELPQGYLDNPNGRMLYQFKSFMLKQADLVRRDAYNEIKTGNRARGIKNLTTLGITLGVAGMSTQLIKDFMLGRPVDLKTSDVIFNALKTFGLTQYFMDQALGVSKEEAKERRKAGDTKARQQKAEPVGAVVKSILPPYKMFEEIARGDPKAWRYIPIVGPVLYERVIKEDKK
jgi:RNA polymerase sigma factor (sigma-70 family)